MKIIRAPDPYRLNGAIYFYDIVIFTCQSMWHLKDWILNDKEFDPKDSLLLREEIHAKKCLLICSDLANGSKHLSLERPKAGFSFLERSGVWTEPGKGVFQEYYYVVSTDSGDPYHGMEIRDLLEECRAVWQQIIDRHCLSKYEI